jgi:hypothetical protein
MRSEEARNENDVRKTLKKMWKSQFQMQQWTPVTNRLKGNG